MRTAGLLVVTPPWAVKNDGYLLLDSEESSYISDYLGFKTTTDSELLALSGSGAVNVDESERSRSRSPKSSKDATGSAAIFLSSGADEEISLRGNKRKEKGGGKKSKESILTQYVDFSNLESEDVFASGKLALSGSGAVKVEESKRSRSRSRSSKSVDTLTPEDYLFSGEVLDYSRLPCHCSNSFLHWPRITSPLVLPERIDGRGSWQRGRIRL